MPAAFFAYLGDAGSDAKEMQELEEIATKLLETARKLPPGFERHDVLKEIGKLRARIAALRRRESDALHVSGKLSRPRLLRIVA
jgi:hypothetical protein